MDGLIAFVMAILNLNKIVYKQKFKMHHIFKKFTHFFGRVRWVNLELYLIGNFEISQES